MTVLIWLGSLMSLSGVGGLMYCIMQVLRARKAKMSDDMMRARLQQIVQHNMIALGVSALGLMLVVAGIVLS